MSAADPFSKGGARSIEGGSVAEALAPSEIGRSEDLLIECGDGDEETISYHLYLGTSLRRQATQLIVRFATRTLIVDGERLGPVRDEIAARRCLRLRVSDRTELMGAYNAKGPVVRGVRVLTPKGGEEALGGEVVE